MSAKKPTMTDIAKLAGVSQSTVSNIVGGSKLSSFPKATVDKVLEAAKELNYTPRKKSRPDSREPQSKTILVLAVKMTNPYYPFVLQSIERAARANGLHVVCGDTYYLPEMEKNYLELAVEQHFLAAIYLYPPVNAQALKKANLLIPVITICDNDRSALVDLVEMNNFKAGCLAAEHLLSLGHRKIAFLTNTIEGNLARTARLAGIRHQMTDTPLECTLNVLSRKSISAEEAMSDNYDYNTGYHLAQDPTLYAQGNTAIVAINDMVALGAMDAVLEKGYRVPGDFSIIGFDNLLYTGFSRISLTTVDNHADLLAQSAMDVLLHRIHLSNSSTLVSEARFKIECQPRLIVRNSTAPLQEKAAQN